MSVNRRRSNGGENRFYCPPAMRRQQQQMQAAAAPTKSSKSDKRTNESDDGASSTSTTATTPSSTASFSTNLDRFLEFTTPKVPSHFFSKTSMRTRKKHGIDFGPYFVLDDLWESFKEWSAYGAGVPLVLNETESVVQYYVPYLSGIQLYTDPSKHAVGPRRPGEESDADSYRETSSDDGSENVAGRGASSTHEKRNQQNLMNATANGFSKMSLRNDPFMESLGDENETSNPPGLLRFEFLEQNPPQNRQPLTDKIISLASEFPELRTYRSCDLTPSSWISVAWYPIYRIPIGPTLQSLDACFLTFHSLSTPVESLHNHGSSSSRGMHDNGIPMKLSLPSFGLASYKFKVSFWFPNEAYESQKVNSLLRAADNWLQLLRVNHPDYRFFISRNTYFR